MSRSRAATSRSSCGAIPTSRLVGECDSGREALAQIRSHKLDSGVSFDIQMPECDGFDVVEQLGRELLPAFVFVTAYDQYALKAFEAGALLITC